MPRDVRIVHDEPIGTLRVDAEQTTIDSRAHFCIVTRWFLRTSSRVCEHRLASLLGGFSRLRHLRKETARIQGVIDGRSIESNPRIGRDTRHRRVVYVRRRTKTFYITGAFAKDISDLEDYYLAERRATHG